MSFRKRNIALSGNTDSSAKPATLTPKIQLPGVRPSAIDGRSVTSTGTASLDGLFAGHGGLALGSSVLIEENGATDYAGALLKFYAAEGLLQGHHVHVLGLPEVWGRELPGVVGPSSRAKDSAVGSEKMKIAWRYESLGQFGASTAGTREPARSTQSETDSPSATQPAQFVHTFDLTKRLTHPPSASLTFHPFSPTPTPAHSPFSSLLSALSASLKTNNTAPHRLIIPSLLTPLLYPPAASNPHHLLPFLHKLRALLTLTGPNGGPPLLTILTTLPLPLSPRSSGLTRWAELLHDGVVELSPFPHSTDTLFASKSQASKTAAAAGDEPPQGLLKVHRLPIFTDRASGVIGQEGGDDWAFTLSRRSFKVRPWRLGPVEGEEPEEAGGGHAHGDAGGGGAMGKKAKKEAMEF